MSPFVSIVIPTLNRGPALEHVLPTLARQTYPTDSCEILLCDAGSTDGTDDLVTSLGIPNLRFLPGENRGRSGARNRGIREARGEIVLFTDADILADEILVEEHARVYRTETGVCAVGCEVQVDSLEEYVDVREHPEKGRRLHKRPKTETIWLYFLTGNASVPREALLEAGLFDEDFTGYGHEDLELGYRLQKMGLRIRYLPSAVNYHWHPVPFDERCKRKELSGASTVRFYRKHQDPRIKLLLGVNPVSMLLHRLTSRDGRLLRSCRERAAGSRFCREIVLQHHYLTGVKAALAQKR